jgi:competence protein ComGG
MYFSIHINQLLSDRKLANETAAIMQQEYYFLSSVKKLEVMLQTGGTIPAKGTINYINGSVVYQIEPPADSVQRVVFSLNLNSGLSVVGYGYFDVNLKRLSKWSEIN